MTKRTMAWAAAIVAAAALVAVVVGSSGARFYTVMTPSMGQVAPVGTLVVTTPAPAYEVGQVVTYEREGRSYTHRIVTANADGTFITKGDLNGAADPLPVSASQVVGRAAWIAPGLGWVWQGLPWLTVGCLLVYACSLFRRLDRTWRWVIRISGWTLVFCLLAFWLRPWVNLTMLAWVPSDGGGVDMHVVNTGLFPLDVLGHRLVSGQDAVVHVTEQVDASHYGLVPQLAFHWWEQLGLFVLCLLPMATSLLIRSDAPAEPSDDVSPAPAETAGTDVPSEAALAVPRAGGGQRRLLLVGALVVAVVISVAVVTFTTTSAAATARISNGTNTARTRTFFTCRGAITSLGSASTWVAFAMGTTGTTEPDLSGRANNNGVYNTNAATTANYGCQRDTPKASVTFNGTTQCLASKSTYSNPQQVSLEAWFSTTSPKAGKVIGFGATRFDPTESTYDRHVYVDNNGRVVFGVYTDTYVTIASPAGTDYADGKWHHVVATYRGGAGGTGTRLYLDGSPVASNTTVTNAENKTGYWKVGCGNLADWPNAAGTTLTTSTSASWFAGRIQYAAVYPVELSPAQVKDHYLAGAA